MDGIDDFIAGFTDFFDRASGVIWGPFVLIPLLFGVGFFLTFRLRGLQFRMLGAALRLGIGKRKDEGDVSGDISQFQALTTALAATVGTGNIVGVATAIAIGGPGALFWMWITGLVGMASKYTEAFLGVYYRRTDDAGEQSGGPQYYLERGIKGPVGKILGLTFTVMAIIASFGIGNLTQGNAVAGNLEESFGVTPWVTGVVLSLAALLVLVGGIRSIGRVTGGLVPFMVVSYVLAALFILAVNITEVPAALAMIFTDAFTGSAATGGFAGAAIIIAVQMGAARGMFSNESGLGSAAIAAAAAKTSHPVRQAMVSMTQTFIDTIIVVTCTGLVIVTTGVWDMGEDAAATMTGAAFSRGLPGDWGHYIVTIALSLFAFSTVLGWAYYGERCVERLVGRRGVMPYRVLFSVVVYVGATVTLQAVWNFSDSLNGLMAIPNLIGLIVLAGLVARETKKYLDHDPTLTATTEEAVAFSGKRFAGA